VSSSTSIISNPSRNATSSTYSLFATPQEQDNDERIQSIFEDINNIVENYTRELDDTLRLSSYRKNSIDTLTEEHQKINPPPPLPPKRQIGNYSEY
jgi:hypothetical protein